MINTFRKLFQVPYFLGNKKATLYRIYGVLEKSKRKKKGKRKTGDVGGPKRATAYFGSSVETEKFCCNRVSLALGGDQVFLVAIVLLDSY